MRDIRIFKVTEDKVSYTTALNAQVIALTYEDAKGEEKSIVFKNCYDIIHFFRDLEFKMKRVDENQTLADKLNTWANTFNVGISVDGIKLDINELVLYNVDTGLVFGPEDLKSVLAMIVLDFIM